MSKITTQTILPEITSTYIDPTTDFGFKKLFGEEANNFKRTHIHESI